MSSKGMLDQKDFQSAVRHILFTLLADATTGGLQTAISLLAAGTVDPMAIVRTVGWTTLSCLLAGAYRLAQRWRLQLDPQATPMSPGPPKQE
mgnify:CR=1 FL=1